MNSKDYWRIRTENKLSMGDKSIAILESECKRLYEMSFNNINKEIEAFYGRYAGMNGLSISDVQKRLNLLLVCTPGRGCRPGMQNRRLIQFGESGINGR